jgi:hypothetical protein
MVIVELGLIGGDLMINPHAICKWSIAAIALMFHAIAKQIH